MSASPLCLSRSRFWLLALPIALAAQPAAADHVFRLARDAKMVRLPAGEVVTDLQEVGVLYIGAAKVRFDQGEQVSWILDTARSELILVRHDLRRFHVLPVPFDLEDFAATPEAKAIVEDRKAQALVGIEVAPRGEKRRIGDFEATRTDLAGRSPDGANRYEYELWLSPEMPREAALYGALLREFGSADLLLRPLARKMADLQGFPVLRRSVAYFPEGRLIDERKLVAVEEKTLPASIFEPPADYQRQPFELIDWLTPK
jgi:hypothetical protein